MRAVSLATIVVYLWSHSCSYDLVPGLIGREQSFVISCPERHRFRCRFSKSCTSSTCPARAQKSVYDRRWRRATASINAHKSVRDRRLRHTTAGISATGCARVGWSAAPLEKNSHLAHSEFVPRSLRIRTSLKIANFSALSRSIPV